MNKKSKLALTIDVDLYEMIISSYGAIPPQDLSTFDDMLEQTIVFFAERDLRVTLFISGNQVKSRKSKQLLRDAQSSGFEIGNHTYNHIANYHNLTYEKCKKEITDNDKFLADIIGAKIVGFRGPGWNWSEQVLDILNELDYLYASNVIPSPIIVGLGKLHAISSLSHLPFRQRKTMGVFSQTFSGNKPYVIKNGNKKALFELPVTVVFQVPMIATIHTKKIGDILFPWQVKKRIWNYSSHGHDFYFPNEVDKKKLYKISQEADHYLNPSFLSPEKERNEFANNLIYALGQKHAITTGKDVISSLI